MLNSEDYKKALKKLRTLEREDNFKKRGGQVAPQTNCDIIEQLIGEYILIQTELEDYKKELDFSFSVIDKMAETLATISGVFDKEEIKNRYYYLAN